MATKSDPRPVDAGAGTKTESSYPNNSIGPAILAPIEEALAVLLEPGAVAELRCLNTSKRTVTGYYNDRRKMARDAAQWSGDAEGVYVCLNPVKPELLARYNNRAQAYAKHATSDRDIERRRWLLVDCDPVRPSGIPSTNEEHEAALARAATIAGGLIAQGWPEPLRADSGNGGHLLAPVDLENSDTDRDLVRRVLEALALRWGDSAVVVDTSTFNAARICKLYGTLAAKGDGTPDRPRRYARLLHVPEGLTPVPREMLERFAGTAPEQPPATRKSAFVGDFNLEDWMRDHNLLALRSGPWNGGTKWVLDVCPWDAAHTDAAAYIVRFGDGAIAAGCHHNGCHGRGWRELRALYEPDAYRTNGRQPGGGAGGDSEERPVIRADGRFLRDLTADAVAALVRANTPEPAVFRRGSALVRLQGTAAEPLTVAALGGILERAADFTKMTAAGPVPARAAHDVILDLLASPGLPLPELQGIALAPTFRPDGSLLATDGYDPGSGFFVSLNGLSGVRPALQVSRALDLLLGELFYDFPFADAGSKAHALELLLRPFARQLIDGPTPLTLADAPVPGSGKGLLVEVAGIVATGSPPPVMSLPNDADELSKGITAMLLEGHPIILLDNVGALRATPLSAVLTATSWRGRRLGKSEMVTAPNMATWIATGNNVRLSDEMVRRIVPVRLDAGVERPEDRTGWRHPLPAWALENRGDLVEACLSLIQAWLDAGRPKGRATLGRFEAWAAVMGGILENAGVAGFLAHREPLYTASASDTADWRAFCGAWWERFKAGAVTPGELFVFAKEKRLLLYVWGGRSELAGVQRLGHALRGHRDRVFGGQRIRYAGEDRDTRNASYRLELVEGGKKHPQTPATPAPVPETGATSAGVSLGGDPETPANTRGHSQNTRADVRTNAGVAGVFKEGPLADAADAAAASIQPSSNPPAATPCRACGGTAWWQRGDERVCCVCHPRPPLVVAL